MAPTAAAKAAATKVHLEESTAVEEAPAPKLKPKKGETIQQLKNRLRNEAEREVLNTHKDEVVTITQAKYDAHGLEYIRRLTEEEKAAKQIEEYFKQFPELRDHFNTPAVVALAQQQAQQEEREVAYAPSDYGFDEAEDDVQEDEDLAAEEYDAGE
jgi:mannose-1-phosphate guanylyltransferase